LAQPIEVSLGDNHIVPAVGRGDVMLHLRAPGGGVVKCRMSGALHVPSLGDYDLLSIGMAADHGIETSFQKKSCRFMLGGKVIACGERVRRGLYVLNCAIDHRAATAVDKAIPPGTPNPPQRLAPSDVLKQWHDRLGHASEATLKQMAAGAVDGLPEFQQGECLRFCEGKQTRAPFKKADKGTRAKARLELVHVDLAGPMATESLGGSRYMMVFVDDFTHFMTVKFLTAKSEAHDALEAYVAEMERQTGARIKVLRSDRGGEFTSDAIALMLRKAGIRHQLTAPYTPQQNGVAERAVRTLTEKARCMLKHARLPDDLWAEAVFQAAVITNVSTMDCLRNGKITPQELMWERKPTAANFHVFGCEAFAHKAKGSRKKFDRCRDQVSSSVSVKNPKPTACSTTSSASSPRAT